MPDHEMQSTEFSIVSAELPAETAAPELSKLRKQVLKYHLKVSSLALQTIRSAILCGMLLLRVKNLLPHGGFRSWVEESFEAETGLGLRTAQRYMNEARNFIDFANGRDHICETDDELQSHIDSPLLAEYDEQRKQSSLRGVAVKPDPNEWESPPEIIQAVRHVLGDIDCDPCALSTLNVTFAELNLTAEQDGLAGENPWPDSAWVCPGHDADIDPWYTKARSEMIVGNLKQAILCFPESALILPDDLLRHPVAITPTPLTVTFHHDGIKTQKPLSTRSLFVYLTTGAADIEKFAEAFRDIAVVFAPVVLP